MRRSAKHLCSTNFKDIYSETPIIHYEKLDKNISVIHVGTYKKYIIHYETPDNNSRRFTVRRPGKCREQSPEPPEI